MPLLPEETRNKNAIKFLELLENYTYEDWETLKSIVDNDF